MFQKPSASRLCIAILTLATGVVQLLCLSTHAVARPGSSPDETDEFKSAIVPLLKQYCVDCHSASMPEGDLNLENFGSLDAVRQEIATWQKVAEMLSSEQMPPKDAPQPTVQQHEQMSRWVNRFLREEAVAMAGDPGPVVLRRLSNAEYKYTIQDLTGLELNPAREFPVDSASGEGFTNTGNSLVMSPALVTKYMEAAKEVSSYVMLLPDGIRFSPYRTQNDRTNDLLKRIREFYGRFTDNGGGDTVNLQGIVFDTNTGGRLPLKRYLQATLTEREMLTDGTKSIEQVAAEQNLSPQYLTLLWDMLTGKSSGTTSPFSDLSAAAPGGNGRQSQRHVSHDSPILDSIRERWENSTADDVDALVADIAGWQQALWRFTTVGHIGKANGPTAWMEPASPLTSRQEFRRSLDQLPVENDQVIFYLTVGDAGDGNEQDYLLWENPRLVVPGRPDLPLRNIRSASQRLSNLRTKLIADTSDCLAAAAEVMRRQSENNESVDAAPLSALAKKYETDTDMLSAWLSFLGITPGGTVSLGTPISRRLESVSGYEFVKGWIGDDALSVLANSSDQHVRIPGNMKPHSIAVHPSPTRSVCIGWKSPVSGLLRIEGEVQHAHPECGNGIVWTVELRRGISKQRLATGVSQGSAIATFGPLSDVRIHSGDVVTLVISPRDGNHACDLTGVSISLDHNDQHWNLAEDLSSEILAGNPHPDSDGNADVWHFFSESAEDFTGHSIPVGSLLAKWQATDNTSERQALAIQIHRLLEQGPGTLPAESPDAVLYQQLTSLNGPLLGRQWSLSEAHGHQTEADQPANGTVEPSLAAIGPDPSLFGKHPNGDPVESNDLCVHAPSVLEIRLPADLAAGAEFVTTARLHEETGSEGSVQASIDAAIPASATGLQAPHAMQKSGSGPWTSSTASTEFSTPIITAVNSSAARRIEGWFEDFRRLFPAALCYTKIVPVDEVVTLTLFYREDHQLQRLILNDAQSAELNRLWDELHYVSQDSLKLVDAFTQLMEFATQDADPSVFEPLRKPIYERADSFRRLLRESETTHVEAMIEFAERACRRPLSTEETDRLHVLYQQLRDLDQSHDEAIRSLLVRILVSPAFLYRLEVPGDGPDPSPVSDWELASRLSYFLWSSLPDEQLRKLAAAGKLHIPEVLSGQVHRMLKDPKIARMAEEFFCQWLQIYDFDQLDEKSERHFPEFRNLRGPMEQESILFFTNLLQQDRSCLELFDCDYVFVNQSLAEHYGISGVVGEAFRRVENAGTFSRGGVLALGAVLSKQSGASRTSPILRGTWLSEVILGEKLPKPPKGVPPLPEEETGESLTVRQMVEKHTSDARCSGCHQKIDPYGFSLEAYDAIGRYRKQDSVGRPVDTTATLIDGTRLTGIDDLRTYLSETRRDAILRQFCRKLLGYSLGRAVQLSDEPLLDDIIGKLHDHGYHMLVAVEAVVGSRQFQQIRGRNAGGDGVVKRSTDSEHP